MLIYPKVKIQYPMSLEREYARILRDYTRGVNQICKDYLPYMVDEAMANSLKADMREDSWISDVTDKVKEAIDSKLRITDKISAMFEKVKGFAKSQQGKIFTSIFGSITKQRPPRDYEMLKQIWTSQNLTLIKSIDDRTMEAIHYALSRNVIRTVDRKELVSELTQTIKHMAGVNEKRAALIACDQVGKLNSQLVQLEQMSQGVEKYKWQTMEDSRVRPQHQSYNQKDFSWSEPPDGGHPGWAIRCRCVAIPLYDTDKIGLQPKAGTFKIVR